jgi:hypothetical protein
MRPPETETNAPQVVDMARRWYVKANKSDPQWYLDDLRHREYSWATEVRYI